MGNVVKSSVYFDKDFNNGEIKGIEFKNVNLILRRDDRGIRVSLNGLDDWFYLDEIDRYFEDAVKKAEEVMEME